MPYEFPKPDYPKILTRKDWDKNKGVIAKLHGEIGLGKKMDEVEKLFGDVDWDKINMTGQRKSWTWGERGQHPEISQPNWDKVFDAAKSEVLGSLAKLSKALYELRDLAQETQANLRRAKPFHRRAPSTSARLRPLRISSASS